MNWLLAHYLDNPALRAMDAVLPHNKAPVLGYWIAGTIVGWALVGAWGGYLARARHQHGRTVSESEASWLAGTAFVVAFWPLVVVGALYVLPVLVPAVALVWGAVKLGGVLHDVGHKPRQRSTL